ncbi:SETMAR [Cordylochernes scorpioides]|uniref:SETMAR n=1 Tax=Cordylochernes scorpioides TaxID=51811 RepID=A0ABY6L414_9ARAC|nr:SETMAR [Cordylochernes scorpioides]
MKALKFYKELKESEPSTSSRESNPQFSASTGWLTGFIKRHSFHNLKIKGEVASADEEAARKYPEKLAKIIKDGGYCAHIKSSMLMKQDCFGKKCLPVLTLQSPKKMPVVLKLLKIEFIAVQQCIWRSNVKTAACKSIFKTTCIKRKRLKYTARTLDGKQEGLDHVALAIAEMKSQTLNACWKAAWPECVSKRNESNRTTIVTSDIISIAKEIGGEGFDDFGEHDIEELLVDEALNDDDILESMIDTTKDFETVELYKELVKPSQRLITDYLVKEKKITEVPKEALPCRSDDVILSSSDESDLAPIHKRVCSFFPCGKPFYHLTKTAPINKITPYHPITQFDRIRHRVHSIPTVSRHHPPIRQTVVTTQFIQAGMGSMDPTDITDFLIWAVFKLMAYGKNALSIKSCEYWFRRFKSGDFDTRDKERGGRPIKFEDAELEALLDEDSSQTQEELTETLGVTQQAISNRLKVMGMVQKQGNWVPYELKPGNIERRICTKSSVKPGHASTSTAKPNIHGKKLMLCIWWDQLGVIYYELLQPNETITGERYQQQLMRLSRTLKIKRPLYAKRHDKVIYQHDNAWPHVAKVVKETLEALQ